MAKSATICPRVIMLRSAQQEHPADRGGNLTPRRCPPVGLKYVTVVLDALMAIEHCRTKRHGWMFCWPSRWIGMSGSSRKLIVILWKKRFDHYLERHRADIDSDLDRHDRRRDWPGTAKEYAMQMVAVNETERCLTEYDEDVTRNGEILAGRDVFAMSM